MGSNAKLLSRQIFPAESICIMEWGKKKKKSKCKRAQKVFLLPLGPLASSFFLSLCSTKSALLAEPLQTVMTTLDNIWLKGECYRLQGWKKKGKFIRPISSDLGLF